MDVEEVAEDERSFGRIARKTGMEAGEIAVFILSLIHISFAEDLYGR